MSAPLCEHWSEVGEAPQNPRVPAQDGGDHLRGGGPGAVSLLMYGDYECPYTRAAYRHVERLERRLGERLRFAFRHFPLTEIHPHAQHAAEAAEAAHAQGRFWEMHELLFRRQRALEDPDLQAYARAVGLEEARFGRELAAHAHAARVERDVRSGRAAGVSGTPTLFLDGERHHGSWQVDELGPLIERLARGG